MFKAFPLLLVGISLAMWGRSMTHDDRVAIGLMKAGQIQLRSTSAAVSLSASEALLKLGAKPVFERSFQKRAAGSGAHSGLHFVFSKPMQWEARAPWWGLALAAGFWLFIRARMTRSA